MQPDLFAPSVNQQRDQAIARVAQHAEEARAGFLEEARQFVLTYLQVHGATSGEQLTTACKAAGIRAHDDRAFGAVFLGLAKRGQIEKCGTVKRAKGHNTSGGNVWRLTQLTTAREWAIERDADGVPVRLLTR